MFPTSKASSLGQAVSPWKLMAESAPPPSEVAGTVARGNGAEVLASESPWHYAPINVIYQHFHNSIRAELRSLAELAHDLETATGGELDKVLHILRERYRFMEQVYRYHSSVEDEVVYPALDAKVRNVTQAYSVEHESEEALFDQLTELLAAALSQSSADRGQSVRLLLEKVSEIHSTVLHHLAKEEEQLFPLLLANFSHAEQAQLVAEFFCSIPLAAVDSVLAWLKPSVPPQEQQELMQQVRGVVSDELLGRLLAAWLRQKHDAPESSGAGEGSAGQQQQQQEEQQQGKDQPPPVLLLHHIHAAIRLALKEFVEETSALEAAAAKGGPGAGLGQQNGADSLASLFEQYRFLRAMCTFHSSSENETVLCAQRLEGAQQQGEEGAAGASAASAAAGGGGGGGHLHLHHPHGGDHHESGSADFDALGRLLADVRSCARRGNKRAAVLATELRRSAEAVRSSVDEHMREEEAEAIPLLASDCSVVEQRQLVWNTIRGMPLRLLESMLPWVASQVNEEQCKQLLETMVLAGAASGSASADQQEEDASGILVQLLVQWAKSGRDEAPGKTLSYGPARGASPPSSSAATALDGPARRALEGGASCSVPGGAYSADLPLGPSHIKRRRLSHALNASGSYCCLDEAGAEGASASARAAAGGPSTSSAAAPRLETQENPIDHIFQFHIALKREVRALEKDVQGLSRCLEGAGDSPAEQPGASEQQQQQQQQLLPSTAVLDQTIQQIEGRFRFLKGIYIAHSECEDNIVFPALERKEVLRNVSHAYSLDHQKEQEMFNDVERLLGELKRVREDPAALEPVVNRLRATCAAVRANLEMHVRAEETELWPLFNEHFPVAEQEEIVGAIIGNTGAEVLQTMITWVANENGPEEQAAMMDALRSATRNTRFDKWLSSVVQPCIHPEAGPGEDEEEAAGAAGAPDEAPSESVNPQGSSEGGAASRREAEALAEAARSLSSLDASGTTAESADFRPGWEDIFLINQQQLEAHVRRVSCDPSIEPNRKAYIIQSIMASRYIVAQQQKKRQAGKRPLMAAAAGMSDLSADGSCCHSTESSTFGLLDCAGTSAAAAAAAMPPPQQQQQQQDPEWPRDPHGCGHYRRNAALVPSCCNRVYTCRLCHDEAEDHKMDRYAVKEMVCKICHVRQPVAGSCGGCGASMAKYYCSICHLFDDSGHDIYHCPACNVCRRGKGLGIDFFHCMKCNACMSLSLYKRHTCREQSLEANCVVCHEYLFDSPTPIKELPCGHFMHSSCLAEYSAHNYTCPICSKSMGDMRVYFQMLDALVASERLPPELASRQQDILCNDCSKQGTARYHWVYHKCSGCGSYNTRIL